ncbi:unnamed protein product [Adineta ricciae]|uniref:RING-type domain-containing protein n=1 Tax=Adineta ricciae TaxID=249248 RepID=A0A815SNC8_ADIRI|nr:unnamed protein product [Adineta ricciae]CAF1491138.1 unnamed protein product [Adineta ricciae]
MPPSSARLSRKRTRSRNLSDNNDDHEPSTSTIVSSHQTNPASRKRKRNNQSSTEPHNNYPLRNHSTTPEAQSQRYNLRPRCPPVQIHLPQVSNSHLTTIPRRARRQTSTAISTPSSITQHDHPSSSSSTSPSSTMQPRQYRLVYISDDDDNNQPTTSSSSAAIVNLGSDNESIPPRRTARSTSNVIHHTRSRTATDPTNTTRTDSQNFSNDGVSPVHIDRAIEIVIDSIQSLEGAVNNFDQLFFSLIYGRLNTRTEYDGTEGMIRLSRILNINFPSRLTQDEIDALPKIQFLDKSDSSSILLAEKCPICLTEFTDQEVINKLHCAHLFHLQCISTWLSENDSCPTCRRKVNGD